MVLDGSDPSVATHTTNRISSTDTTNGISTKRLFINPTIQAFAQPTTPLGTSKVEVLQESLSLCQTSLPQANVTDAARPCAQIFRTTENVIGTERDRATPRDAYSSETRSRASCRIPTFIATSVSPTRIGNKCILSTSNSSTARRVRNAKPFDVSINGFPAISDHVHL